MQLGLAHKYIALTVQTETADAETQLHTCQWRAGASKPSSLPVLFPGCARSLWLLGLFSSCCKWRLLPSCGVLASQCCGFSCYGEIRVLGRQQLQHVDSVVASGLWRTGSIAVAQVVSCRWLFLDEGSDPCLLHWQADSLLSHQGSSHRLFLITFYFKTVMPIHMTYFWLCSCASGRVQ